MDKHIQWEYHLEDWTKMEPKPDVSDAEQVVSRANELGKQGWEWCWNEPPHTMFKRPKGWTRNPYLHSRGAERPSGVA